MLSRLREFLSKGNWKNHVKNRKITSIDYKFMTENSIDVILHVGPEGQLLYASPSCLEVFGRTADEMLKLNTRDLVNPEDLARITDLKTNLLAGSKEITVDSFRPICKDGNVCWLEGNAKVVHNRQTGKLDGLVIVLRDVSARKALEDRLTMQALTDGLTGLANRRAFDEALDREWRVTLRQGTQMSLLLLDIDCFKGFNDKYGHQVGDDCLRAVASTVHTALLRPGDFSARYGGEELAVILPGTDGPGAIEVAERIRTNVQALSLPHETNQSGNYRVSVSIGVATAISLVGGTMTMPEGLLAAADTALYKAKYGGRNRVESALLLTATKSTRK